MYHCYSLSLIPQTTSSTSAGTVHAMTKATNVPKALRACISELGTTSRDSSNVWSRSLSVGRTMAATKRTSISSAMRMVNITVGALQTSNGTTPTRTKASVITTGRTGVRMSIHTSIATSVSNPWEPSSWQYTVSRWLCVYFLQNAEASLIVSKAITEDGPVINWDSGFMHWSRWLTLLRLSRATALSCCDLLAFLCHTILSIT